MIKIFQTKRGEATFLLRIWIQFLGAITITYIVLWYTMGYGSIGLFFGGVIAGGLWGKLWDTLFSDAPRKKWLPKNPLFYVIFSFIMLGLLIFLLLFYPLPQI